LYQHNTTSLAGGALHAALTLGSLADKRTTSHARAHAPTHAFTLLRVLARAACNTAPLPLDPSARSGLSAGHRRYWWSGHRSGGQGDLRKPAEWFPHHVHGASLWPLRVCASALALSAWLPVRGGAVRAAGQVRETKGEEPLRHAVLLLIQQRLVLKTSGALLSRDTSVPP